ncbi:MAG: hypothetical protein IIV60_05265 [Alistipes sp.]|nr:hypothetical protein [Alistipes sp.]
MIYTLYIIATLGVTIFYTVITQLYIHSQEKHCRLRNRYLHLASAAALSDSDSSAIAITATTRSERLALIDALYSIASHCYDHNQPITALIARENNLEKHLLRELRFATKYRRGLLWLQLSTISPSPHHTLHLRQELHNSDPHIRSCSLIALLCTSPEESIKTLQELDFELQPYDISRIISLVRRGILPFAFERLLQSGNYNLKLLAISIVRHFNLDIYTKYIYSLLGNKEHPKLITEVIYTLTTMKHPLNSPLLRRHILAMPPSQRKALCRHLSAEGYSLQALRWLLPNNEMEYAERLITSHKRQLSQSNRAQL